MYSFAKHCLMSESCGLLSYTGSALVSARHLILVG